MPHEVTIGASVSSAAAAITRAQVEIAIRAKLQLAAVVVGVGRMADDDHRLRAGRIGNVRVGRHRVTYNLQVARCIGVVNVEIAVAGVVGMEGDAEQALFIAVADERRNVQERRRQQAAVLVDANAPPLLDDEEAAAITRRGGGVDRPLQTAGNQGQVNVRCRAGFLGSQRRWDGAGGQRAPRRNSHQQADERKHGQGEVNGSHRTVFLS